MFNRISSLGSSVSLLAAVLAAGPLRAEVVTLKPVADTSLFEHNPGNNLGRSWLSAGSLRTLHKSRALVRFDLSGIPANAVINSATVTFKVVRTPSGGAASTFELRRVLQPWTEGTKGGQGTGTSAAQGTAAAAGESSWNSRGGANWGSPGGAVGTDFAATASAAQPLSGTSLAFASTAGLVADVQAWVASPAGNHGWVLLSQSEATAKSARRFASRETTSPANSEPTLVINYTVSLPATPPLLAQPRRVGDDFEFQFQAEANRAYTVEFSPNLLPGSWQTLKTIPASPQPATATVQDPLGSPLRFYRVWTP